MEIWNTISSVFKKVVQFFSYRKRVEITMKAHLKNRWTAYEIDGNVAILQELYHIVILFIEPLKINGETMKYVDMIKDAYAKEFK